MNIYLDMDGVVARWIKGAADFHGLNGDEIEKTWPYGVKADQHIADLAGISRGRFWKFDGYDFYVNLDEYCWMRELISLVKSYDKEWMFLTSPTQSPMAWSGKAEWLRQRGYQPRERLIITAKKERLAYNSLLIDDTRSKIDSFVSAGGKGILFPAPWNGLTGDPIQYVARKLEQL
jgi:5'(3')-deoxyribonucleotidase